MLASLAGTLPTVVFFSGSFFLDLNILSDDVRLVSSENNTAVESTYDLLTVWLRTLTAVSSKLFAHVLLWQTKWTIGLSVGLHIVLLTSDIFAFLAADDTCMCYRGNACMNACLLVFVIVFRQSG